MNQREATERTESKTVTVSSAADVNRQRLLMRDALEAQIRDEALRRDAEELKCGALFALGAFGESMGGYAGAAFGAGLGLVAGGPIGGFVGGVSGQVIKEIASNIRTVHPSKVEQFISMEGRAAHFMRDDVRDRKKMEESRAKLQEIESDLVRNKQSITKDNKPVSYLTFWRISGLQTEREVLEAQKAVEEKKLESLAAAQKTRLSKEVELLIEVGKLHADVCNASFRKLTEYFNLPDLKEYSETLRDELAKAIIAKKGVEEGAVLVKEIEVAFEARLKNSEAELKFYNTLENTVKILLIEVPKAEKCELEAEIAGLIKASSAVVKELEKTGSAIKHGLEQLAGDSNAADGELEREHLAVEIAESLGLAIQQSLEHLAGDSNPVDGELAREELAVTAAGDLAQTLNTAFEGWKATVAEDQNDDLKIEGAAELRQTVAEGIGFVAERVTLALRIDEDDFERAKASISPHGFWSPSSTHQAQTHETETHEDEIPKAETPQAKKSDDDSPTAQLVLASGA